MRRARLTLPGAACCAAGLLLGSLALGADPPAKKTKGPQMEDAVRRAVIKASKAGTIARVTVVPNDGGDTLLSVIELTRGDIALHVGAEDEKEDFFTTIDKANADVLREALNRTK